MELGTQENQETFRLTNNPTAAQASGTMEEGSLYSANSCPTAVGVTHVGVPDPNTDVGVEGREDASPSKEAASANVSVTEPVSMELTQLVSAPSHSPAPCSSKTSLASPTTHTADVSVPDPTPDVGGVSWAGASLLNEAVSVQGSISDPLSQDTSQLVKLLLEKHRKQEPVRLADMQRVIKYEENFPEIFRRASELLELVFGLMLKEEECSGHSYVLISKLSLSSECCLCYNSEQSKTGLVMLLLTVIFIKGNRASEEEMWRFLNSLGIYAGMRNLIFGEPRNLITRELVHEQYLKYSQVPNTDPPTYEFLWGPRAYAETTKMKVLEFLAKLNDTVPRCFPHLYAEAVKDEQERARLQAEDRSVIIASSSVDPKITPLSS
ncbi:melanoma-associated antigen B1-like [Ochotona curzoniae]|uniref:melanoma-associated antigen B1-like n=1 Tax=Ochotona curzoniae TaxID=130825 RepID=UPI001B34D570|nr:melanoma-associated antigen B1-like [Ochotona curzoniae]